MDNFVPSGQSYRGGANPCFPDRPVVTLRIAEIRRGVRRRVGGDFDRDRMIRILSGVAADLEMPAIIVRPMAQLEGRFSHQLYAGFHRFSASIAAGFTYIPAVIVDLDL